MTAPLSLCLRRHEFATPEQFVAPAGQTLRQILEYANGGDDLASTLVVSVRGGDGRLTHVVPPEHWARVRPKPGTEIQVTRMALAGGSARQIVAAVAMIVVAAYAPGWGAAIAKGAGWSAGVGQAIGMGITMVASLAINALVSVPVAAQGGDTQRSWNALTGSSNQINPWGVIPLVIGEHRLFPTHAAMPYTEAVGYHSYQHCMFELGHGLMNISDLRIGDTAAGSYNGFEWELSGPGAGAPTLYTNDVSELSVMATMNSEGDVVTRATDPAVDSIGLDLLFAQGLLVYGDSMNKGWPMWVLWRVEYRRVGTSAWSTPPSTARMSMMVRTWQAGGSELPVTAPGPGLFLVKAQTRDPFAAGLTWDVPNGQYEVRVTRVARKNQTTRSWADGATFTALRSVRITSPSSTNTSKLNTRILSTDQLTGTLQTFSCMVRQQIAVYNRSNGGWSNQYTRNTAWVVYWLMTQCLAVGRRVPASRMDLTSFADYAAFCTTHQLEARTVLDIGMPLIDLVRKILAASLADLGMRDGKYCVIFDRGEPATRFTFTPLEMSDFAYSRRFVRIPHALRVQFRNPDADWSDDEIIVVRDGYSYRGMDARGNPSSDPAATLFETLRIEHTMYARQAWQVARYHFAQALFRGTTYTWTSDIAGLGVIRGDVVDVAHDVAEWGTGWGRVQSLTAGGPTGAATLVLDAEVETELGMQYGVQIRTATGGRIVVPCTPHSALTGTFYLDSLPGGVAHGDAVVVGVRGEETATVIVTDVKYRAGLTTTFTAVNYDERVMAYWASAPENIVSEVSGRDYGLPDPPNVAAVVSTSLTDERDDAGISRPVVRVSTSPRNEHVRLHLV